MAGENTKVYRPQGGDSLEVASGGSINVASGGAVAIASGGTLTVAGVTVDASTLALTGLTATATELNKLAAVTAGTVAASKGVVVDTNKDISAFRRVGLAVATVTPGATTAAAGTTTADAGALPAGTSSVYPTTAADDTKGVVVNAADKVTGRVLLVGNGVSNKILKVYPAAGGTINGAAADAAFSSASGKGVVIVCLDSTANTWLAF